MARPRRLIVSALLSACAVGSSTLLAAPAAQAATTASVRVGGSLKMRAAPTMRSAIVGTVRNGAQVSIACQVSGQHVRGSVRATAQWDRLTNGHYISHAYVRGTAWIPSCTAAPAAAAPAAAAAAAPAGAGGTVAGTVRSNHGPVRVHAGASGNATIRGSLRNGTAIAIVCAVTGQYVRGTAAATAQWDRLTNGAYISHAYVASGPVPRCDAPAPVAPPATTVAAGPVASMSNAQFIAASVPGAQQGWREFGVPPSVTIAQGILESGWGRSALSTNDRNYFGIKCFGSPGPIAIGCRSYATTECDPTGGCFPTTATFRSYAAVGDSYRDHGYFLRTNKRYAPAFAHTRDANTFLWHVWKAGYATDPQYYTKVTGIMQRYNLYQYDTWR